RGSACLRRVIEPDENPSERGTGVLTVINSGSKIHAVLTNDAGELRAFSRDQDGEEWSDSSSEALDENASFILDTVYEQYEADDEVEQDEGFDEDELDAEP